MTIGSHHSHRAAPSLSLTLIFAAPAAARASAAGPIAPIALVPHRAIYDLVARPDPRQLADCRRARAHPLRFRRQCLRGYSLEFRQLSELDSGEGKVTTSDLHSTTWEGGDAKKFKFTSQNFVDENLVNTVDGHAEHGATATAVDLTKPEHKTLDLDAGVVFPTEHMVRAIAAGLAGKTILSFPVFDGSETGDKVFNTLTVIGHKIAPKDAPARRCRGQ